MYAKIDIYVSGSYVCSTNQAKDLETAKKKFIKNPRYMGANGITKSPDGIVTAKWANKD